jgi:hypothetical protein
MVRRAYRGLPRRGMEAQHLADPGRRRVIASEERSTPVFGLRGERDVPAAALHRLDDHAESAPGVEPAAQRGDLGRRLPELE